MKRRILPLLSSGVPSESQNSIRLPVPVCTFTIVSLTMRRSRGSSMPGPALVPVARQRRVIAPALVVPDDLPQLFLLVVGEGVERLERHLVEVDVLVVIRMVRILGLHAHDPGVAQLPAIVGVGQAVRAEVVLLLVRIRLHLRVHGRDHLLLAQALPFVLRDDAGEAAEVVEREVGARDRVRALRGRDPAHAAERRHVDPGVVVLRLVARPVRRLVAIGQQHDAARVEGRVHLRRRRRSCASRRGRRRHRSRRDTPSRRGARAGSSWPSPGSRGAAARRDPSRSSRSSRAPPSPFQA